MAIPNESDKWVLTPEGYAVPDGEGWKRYVYVRDVQGNIRAVVGENNAVAEQTDYYPYGMPMADVNSSSAQPFKFGGKELEREGGMDFYDFEARRLDFALGRFTSPDPLCEQTPEISPYAYCANNPVNFIDPTGESTVVVDIGNGRYQVIGGNINDNDYNIYLSINGKTTTQSIGKTTSITSFYGSESKQWQGIIDISDNSGISFLNNLMNDSPLLLYYMINATDSSQYDFKFSNGEKSQTKKLDHYRGMSIYLNGEKYYTSARDIGNIGAGYIAGKNGIGWGMARIAFDIYQSGNLFAPEKEGISTQNAEKLGWNIGYKESPSYQFETSWKETISVWKECINTLKETYSEIIDVYKSIF